MSIHSNFKYNSRIDHHEHINGVLLKGCIPQKIEK